MLKATARDKLRSLSLSSGVSNRLPSPTCGRGAGGEGFSRGAVMSAVDMQTLERAPRTAQRMAEAAQGLVASLNARQRERLHLPWGEERFVWDWLPGEA